jgi:hypothetical protein
VGGTSAAEESAAGAASSSGVPGRDPASIKPNAISNAPVSPEPSALKGGVLVKKPATRRKVANVTKGSVLDKPSGKTPEKPRAVQRQGHEHELLVQAYGRPMPIKPLYRPPVKAAPPVKGAPPKPVTPVKSTGPSKPAAIVKSAPSQKPATPVKAAAPEKPREPVKTVAPSKGSAPVHAAPAVKSSLPPRFVLQKPTVSQKPAGPPSKERGPSK